VHGQSPAQQDAAAAHDDGPHAALLFDSFDGIADGDSPVRERVGAQSAAVDEHPEHPLPGDLFEVATRLAERGPAREHAADPERPSDESVQRDPARGHIPARLARRQLELLEHLGLDEREIAADPLVAPEAAAPGIPIAADAVTGSDADNPPRLHRRAGDTRDVQTLDAAHASTIDNGMDVSLQVD
jgi:hypothetical protein